MIYSVHVAARGRLNALEISSMATAARLVRQLVSHELLAII